MSAFQIGDFEFINLSSAISRPYERVSLERKPGVDGVTAWQNGRAGEPFVLVSSVNPADINSADSLLVQYQALIGQNPVTVRWGGNALNGIKVLVVNVQPLDGAMFATLTAVGGINANSRAMLYAQWTLLSLDVNQ